MSAVARARGWLHTSGTRLFGENDIRQRAGGNSWLHTFFDKPILFFGIGLGENKVFLSLLLIKRAKYFSKHMNLSYQGYAIHTAAQI